MLRICAITFSHLSALVHSGSQLFQCVCVLLQFDIHSPASTVKEALNFSAELSLEGVDAKQRKAFVGEVVFWHQPSPPVFSGPGSPLHAACTLSGRRCKFGSVWEIKASNWMQMLELMELTPLMNALVGVPGASGVLSQTRCCLHEFH